MELGKFIKEKRRITNLTQPQLAEKAGVGLRFIRELEQGKESLRLDKVNEVLKAFFLGHGIKLIDFKLEFGRFHGEILLADEISPDTCRLWDAKTNEKLDKDRFRRDMGDVKEAYIEILKRIEEKQ